MFAVTSRSDPPTAPSPVSDTHFARADGAARVAFTAGSGGARLADLYQRSPCRVMFPRVDAGDPPQAVLINTAGGLTGGDRIALDLRVGEAVSATVTAQAAEKIYRAIDRDCRIDVALTVARGGRLEWLPQETILFDGARMRRRTTIDVAGGGRLFACESLVLGRLAHGEILHAGLVHDQWRVRYGGRLVWADALRLDGAIEELVGQPALLGGARALATAIYVADDAGDHVDCVRALLADSRNRAGLSALPNILVMRIFGPDPAAVRGELACFCARFRHAVAGLPARMPRVWSC